MHIDGDITGRKENEQGISQAKESLENIFNIAVDGIIISDEQGRIMRVNKAVEKMLGFRADELIGKHTAELVPQDAPHLKIGHALIAQIHDKGFIENWVTEWLKKDGSRCPIEMSISFLLDQDGMLRGAVGSIRDITERNRVEQALKESEERYRSVVQSANDAIVTIDSNGKILYWNKGAEAIYGFSAEEAIGSSFQITVPERFHGSQAIHLNNFLTTKTAQPDIQLTEGIGRRKDNTEFPLEFSASVWQSEARMFFTGISRDISERKQAEQALRESEERFRILAESASDAIMLIDKNGFIIFWNRTAHAVFGYCHEEIMGRHVDCLVPKHHRASTSFMHLKPDTATPLMGRIFEVSALKKDGTEFSAELSYASWQRDKELFYFAIIRDITHRKRFEDMLGQVNTCLLKFVPEADENIIRVVETAGNLLNGFSAAYARKKGSRYHIQADWQLPEEVPRNLPLQGSLFGHVLACHNAEPVLLDDRAITMFFSSDLLVKNLQLTACTGAVIYAADDVSGALLIFYNSKKPFVPSEFKILSILAKAITSEEERQKVLDRLRKNQQKLEVSEKNLKEFSRRILAVREEEKKRLSMNLHDELGSMSVTISNSLSIAEDSIAGNNIPGAVDALRQIKNIFSQSVGRLKKMAIELRPPDLDILGLRVALQDYCLNIAQQTGMLIEVRISINDRQISSDMATAFYRIAQEALTNIMKHSQAQHAVIELALRENLFYFTIRDDGKGFHLQNSALKTGRVKLGVQGMKERIEFLGGTFNITSAPLQGTIIAITLPHTKKGDHEN
ncbi:MAG: PAS domain S-box protein [Pseudomonadota bacterium]